ncbi:hypothetical protein [Kineococcus sp. NPDC059986]
MTRARWCGAWHVGGQPWPGEQQRSHIVVTLGGKAVRVSANTG